MFSPLPRGSVVTVDAGPDDESLAVVAVPALTVVAVFAAELDAFAVVLGAPGTAADVVVTPSAAAVVSVVLGVSSAVVVDSTVPTASDFLLLPPQPAATSPMRATGTQTRRHVEAAIRVVLLPFGRHTPI